MKCDNFVENCYQTLQGCWSYISFSWADKDELQVVMTDAFVLTESH